MVDKEIARTTDLAERADKCYSDAIKAQFGPKANRFDHDKSTYNDFTLAAYNLKVSCDDDMNVAWENYRNA